LARMLRVSHVRKYGCAQFLALRFWMCYALTKMKQPTFMQQWFQ
jgi:hypothetical protein